MARNPLTTSRPGFGVLGGSDPFLSLHREMNRLFDDVLRGSGPPAMSGSQGQGDVGSFVNASMNVSETEKEFRITAELPGVAEQDIDVSLDDDVLTIRGEKRFERKDEKESFHFVECSYGTFQRSLRLPFEIDPEQVQAHFENGVLTVTVPKTGRQERSRRIQVQGRGMGNPGSRTSQNAQGSEGSSGSGDEDVSGRQKRRSV
ncbi:Hsp20/alpha crystallin family protein [Microvirga subterranea]|uniref:HSP20 family protein n=1 Tax=Microvirga subterranea TaxID=186651 RepID=A0A370H2R6_9HYPH|nr:Hsp20/alpha crystallin family protein [Microvirga subterranea]RDI50509.1 HSP20 family protein [Microvirga subterranea]